MCYQGSYRQFLEGINNVATTQGFTTLQPLARYYPNYTPRVTVTMAIVIKGIPYQTEYSREEYEHQ